MGKKTQNTVRSDDVRARLCVCVFQIAAEVRTAKRELKKARTVLQMDKLKCRKRVLRRLGFASPSDVIEMKGRVACEISRWEDGSFFPNVKSMLCYFPRVNGLRHVFIMFDSFFLFLFFSCTN